jgi:TPR repeat protein
MLSAQLKADNPPTMDAHDLLLQKGYQFIGYHGTNVKNLRQIVPSGFDPKFIGTGIGTERGYGFYVSWSRMLAKEYAEKGCILRIYVKGLQSLRLNIDYKWGLKSTPGDPNGELDVERNADRGANDLELVLSPSIYHKLVAIPAITSELEKKLDKDRVRWNSYLIDERDLKILGQEQLCWFPSPPLKRQYSDVRAWNSLQKWTQFGNVHLSNEERYKKGLKYYYGKESDVDMKKARYWFLSAADDHPGAQHLLGDIYENGREVPIDMKKAIHYYKRAHLNKYVCATFALGYCYERGKGVPKDLKKAKELYQIAYNQGYEGWEGYFNSFLQRNTFGESISRTQQLSSEQQYQKGLLYYHGAVVDCDMVRARHFFELAANDGHPGAREKLGDIYEHGRGVSIDIEKALKFYRMAASSGDVQAIFSLGYCHEMGKGVKKDLVEALGYYTEARKRGYEGWSGYYKEFVRRNPEVTPYLESSVSHRRFVLGKRN